jgi:hypothetical protein
MTDYRKGSAGAADKKESILISIVFGVITLGVLLLQFVIPSQYRTEVKDASGAWNVIGFILALASFGAVVRGAYSDDETKGYKWAWAILLVLSFFCAAGWFDNPHSYLNN